MPQLLKQICLYFSHWMHMITLVAIQDYVLSFDSSIVLDSNH